VTWQAATLAVVSLAVAVPLGTAAGRIGWRLFAGHLGVISDVSMPAAQLALVIPGTIALTCLISIGPAVATMRTRPAAALRAE
jgi:hypothetical protein